MSKSENYTTKLVGSNEHVELPNHSESLDCYFKINTIQIDQIFECYMKGKRELEIQQIKALGGKSGLLEKLKSNPEKGLIGDDFQGLVKPKDELERIQDFSDNVKIEAPLKTCCQHAYEILQDLMLILLICSAIVQIVLGSIPAISEDPSKEWVEGFSIIVAVVVVVSVGSITNYSKEKAFKELNKKTQDELEIPLIRNGEIRQYHPDNILVGDILKFQNGKTIPVDGFFLNGHNVEMDESPLTGESNRMRKTIFEEVEKDLEKTLANSGNPEKLNSSLVFSGTKCVNGNGIMLVLRIGKNSEIGKIEGRIAAEDGQNTLEEKLNVLAGDIGKFGMIAAIVTLASLLIRFGVSYSSSVNQFNSYVSNSTLAPGEVDPYKPEDPSLTVGRKILRIILLCIAIIVVAIPEGLPLAVTLSLAFAIAKMQKENNLVRSMTSCETMGSANFVCTDKTGTLTKNLMKIEMVYNLEKDIKVTESDKKLVFSNDSNFQKLFEQSISINISIGFEIKDGKREITKDCNPTDKAFMEFLQDSLKLNFFDGIDHYFSDEKNVKIIPFNSETKLMTSIVRHPDFGISGWRVFIKGGPDVILPKCIGYYKASEGKNVNLSEEKNSEITNKMDYYACESLRTVALAYKDVDDSIAANFDKLDQYGNISINNDGFNLLGVIGIKDPLKEGVLEAVKSCKKSGIRVIMVTGDYIETARAISSECAIIDYTQNEILKKEYEKEKLKKLKKSTEIFEKSNIALGGPEFSSQVGLICDNESCKKPTQNLTNDNTNNDNKIIDLCKCFTSEYEKKNALKKKPNDEVLKNTPVRKEVIANLTRFQQIVKNLRIIARARPVDKYILVLGLKSLGNVVAVTGDGTNDAQALAKADVGFAMGKAGTDIAKDASDIILLDDNFASIITAVKYGRNIFDCIRKFIQFQLTVNLCACLLVFISACIGNETPLSAIQMLWVNLIMDSLGSLALATEPPNEKKLLGRKPYGRNEYIVGRLMWKHIIGQSVVQLGLMLFLYLYAPKFIRESEPYRIAEADLLFLCFGKYPGLAPDNDGYFIIDGSSNAWDISSTIKKGFTVRECGDYALKSNMEAALLTYNKNYGNSAHMTLIFNTFVLYTLFNQLNARVLDDSFNIFLDIQKNPLFIIIEICEFGIHAVLIQFSGSIFKCSYRGLTDYQWAICFGFASVSFIVNFILKLFCRPSKEKYRGDDEKDLINEDEFLLVTDKKKKSSSKNKNMFDPLALRNSSNRSSSLKQHFPK
jgi:Ca2+ transporting ATPase